MVVDEGSGYHETMEQLMAVKLKQNSILGLIGGFHQNWSLTQMSTFPGKNRSGMRKA